MSLILFLSYLILQRGEVWVHKTSLAPPLFVEVHEPSQGRERTCICSLWVSSLNISLEFQVGCVFRHDIAEILLKVALNTILQHSVFSSSLLIYNMKYGPYQSNQNKIIVVSSLLFLFLFDTFSASSRTNINKDTTTDLMLIDWERMYRKILLNVII